MALRLLLTVSLFTCSASKYANIVEFKSLVYNPSVAAISYELVNRTYVNYNLTLLKVFNTDVLCSLHIKKVQGKNKLISLLHWRHFNYCKFLDIYKTDKIRGVLFAHFMQPSFLMSCPLREGFYYLKNAYFEVGSIENVLPHGMYQIQLDVSIIEDGIDRILSCIAKVSL